MRGYWNTPDLTSRTFRKGFFPGETVLFSGDYFKRDEKGFLYFSGRKDDMIKVKSERGYPKEVEDVIRSFEEVSEFAVIGVKDELLGESI